MPENAERDGEFRPQSKRRGCPRWPTYRRLTERSRCQRNGNGWRNRLASRDACYARPLKLPG